MAASDKRISVISSLLAYLSRTHPLLLVLHLFYIGIASAFLSSAYVISFHWDSLVRIYEEAHSVEHFGANLKTNVEIDNQIYRALDEILVNGHAMRAYVYRYHNGLAAISGVPFFFQTMTHEVISAGSGRLIQFEQRIPVGIHMNINNDFVNDRCAVIDQTDKDRSHQNYYFYESRRAKALIRCPIYMRNGDLFGFVGLDFTDYLRSDGEQQMLRLRDTTTKIGALFATMDAQKN